MKAKPQNDLRFEYIIWFQSSKDLPFFPLLDKFLAERGYRNAIDSSLLTYYHHVLLDRPLSNRDVGNLKDLGFRLYKEIEEI